MIEQSVHETCNVSNGQIIKPIDVLCIGRINKMIIIEIIHKRQTIHAMVWLQAQLFRFQKMLFLLMPQPNLSIRWGHVICIQNLNSSGLSGSDIALFEHYRVNWKAKNNGHGYLVTWNWLFNLKFVRNLYCKSVFMEWEHSRASNPNAMNECWILLNNHVIAVWGF